MDENRLDENWAHGIAEMRRAEQDDREGRKMIGEGGRIRWLRGRMKGKGVLNTHDSRIRFFIFSPIIEPTYSIRYSNSWGRSIGYK